jgi:hypothetical protein
VSELLWVPLRGLVEAACEGVSPSGTDLLFDTFLNVRNQLAADRLYRTSMLDHVKPKNYN